MLFVSVALASSLATAVIANPLQLQTRSDAISDVYVLRQVDVDAGAVASFSNQYQITSSGSNRAGTQAYLTLERLNNDLLQANSTIFAAPNLDTPGCNQTLSYLEGPFEPDIKAMVNSLVAKKSLFVADGLKPIIANELNRSRNTFDDSINYLCTRQCLSPVSRCLAVRGKILDDLQSGVTAFTS